MFNAVFNAVFNAMLRACGTEVLGMGAGRLIMKKVEHASRRWQACAMDSGGANQNKSRNAKSAKD